MGRDPFEEMEPLETTAADPSLPSEAAEAGAPAPEAQAGGPLAIVKDGDQIVIDIPRRKLELRLGQKEIKERLAMWRPPQPKIKEGYLARYAKLVSTASEGAVFA